MARKRKSTQKPASKKTPKRKAKKKSEKRTSKKKKVSRTKKKASARASKPSEILQIAVTFRRPGDGKGLVGMGAAVDSVTRQDFKIRPDVGGSAARLLSKHGFSIVSSGEYSYVASGKRSDFEKLFGTKLSAHKINTEASHTASAQSVYYPAADAPWNPNSEIQQLIDDAYIQWPHLYFNHRFTGTESPLPPQVDYHHLRVPGDVAMLLNAARAHRAGFTGRGVRVAMIDSGFNHSLNYFQEMGYNTTSVLAAGASHVDLDDNGHGTGESANTLAVAPDVEFIGVKLDSRTGSGASILAGFHEARRHNPQVISVSLGFDLCPTDAAGRRNSNMHLTSLPNGLRALEAEVNDAVDNGIVVIFSAGNGHVAFPGMMPSVVSAGGVFVDSDGEMQASTYASAFQSKIYVGRNVPDFSGLVGMASNSADYIMLPIQSGCAIDDGNASHDGTTKTDGWGVFSGTSAAAPQLAGVCALLLEKDPSLTPSDIKQILRRTSRDVILGNANPASNEDQGGMAAGTGGDGATGTGLVDAFEALNAV